MKAQALELNKLALVARTRWKSIVSMVVLGLLIAGVISTLMPKKYESTAKIYLAVNTTDPTSLYTQSAYLASRLKSYAELAHQRTLLERIIDELSLGTTPGELSQQVTAAVQPETVILSFTVEDRNPIQAQQIADTGSQLLSTYIEELETARGAQTPTIQATITDTPIVNNSAVSPKTMLNLALAALIGLILGAALAAVREVMDNSVRDVEDIEDLSRSTVLASMPLDRRAAREPLLTDGDGFSTRGEAFRMLRTNLQFLNQEDRPRSIVVTSAVAGEGKTQVATNLAIALAQAGQRVVVVDGDLRRPQVAPTLGLSSATGLITVLVGQTPLEQVIQVHEPSGVHCLASGPTPPNPSEVLQTGAMSDLLAKLRSEYDTVIIDAPPVLPVADASILGTAADGLLLVTRYGKTSQDELKAASRRLRTVGGKLFGVVLNMVPKSAGSDNNDDLYDDDLPAAGHRKKDKS